MLADTHHYHYHQHTPYDGSVTDMMLVWFGAAALLFVIFGGLMKEFRRAKPFLITFYVIIIVAFGLHMIFFPEAYR